MNEYELLLYRMGQAEEHIDDLETRMTTRHEEYIKRWEKLMYLLLTNLVGIVATLIVALLKF